MINRAIVPEPTQKLSFDIPKINQLKLSNGIEIFFVHKNNLPVVYVSLLTEAGSKFDPAGKKGLSYLTSLLIDEGAGEFDAIQLSDEFEKLGTIFSVSADQDHIDFSMFSLTENFDRSLYLLGKILTEPRFSQKDFDREKKKVLDRILQLRDDASYIASTVFEKLIFQNSFYELSEMGSALSVENISLKDVTDFYKNVFSSLSTKVIVVGNLDENILLPSFENTIGKLQNRSTPNIVFNKPSSSLTKYYIIDKKDSAQCEIRIGHIAKKRTSPDFYATRIMNSILGGQFSSRINLNLREAKGYTYGAHSNFSYYKDSGMFEVNTAVNIENTADAVKEILKEIDGIKKEITEKEIEFAKSYLIKQYPSRFETYSQIAKNIETLVVHSLSFDELDNYVENIENLTNGEILLSGKQNIYTNELIIVLCGEKEKIITQLKNELNITAIELDYEGNVI